MQKTEAFDLARILAEIEDDIASEAADLDQHSDISQDVISQLVSSGLRKQSEGR